MDKDEITELYSKQAGSLRTKGRYKDAERLALSWHSSDSSLHFVGLYCVRQGK